MARTKEQKDQLKSLVDQLRSENLSTDEIQARVDEQKAKFDAEQTTTVEVTDEIQTTPTEGKTNGAVETDAAVAPVITPSRASMIVDAQPESTVSDSVDTSGELQANDQGYFRQERKKGRLADSIRRDTYEEGSLAAIEFDKKSDKRKQQATLATKEIQTAQENIPQKDIQSQQANIYFDLPSIAPRDKMDYVYQGAYGMGQSSKPMFESDEDYTTYLKDKLGDKYDQYLEFNKTGSITPNGTQENEDELRSLQVDARNQISAKISNDMLYNVPEDVQQYMTSSPVFASGNTLEEQKFAIDELGNNIGQMKVNYAEGVKAYNENAVPLIDEIKSIDNTIKDLGGTNEGLQFYEAGQVGGLDSPKRIQQYNDLIEQRNSLLNQYNEGGFNVLYDGLISQERVINQEAENYINLVNTSRNKIVDSKLLKDAISKDYSATARVGRAFDEFFLQSGRNVLDLSAEIGLEAFKFALKPEYRPAIDDVISVVQQNNKNYNLEMDAKRKQLPTAPTLDDIGENNIGFFDWFSVAMQDNSPTIATTFIPGGLAAKGAAGVKAAVKTGSYAAKKAALQNQKKLWLAGKRTLQTAFFVAETGGQYGRLQTEEGDREQQISLLQSQLNDTESLEDRTKIYNKIEELKSVEDYSLFQKAFTSFGYGTTATLAETFGTLKLIQGGKALAKNIGTQAAKKEFYSKPSTFAAGIISKAVPGLSPLVKGVAVEEMEETLTQVSHNMFDVFVLGENKNLIDGLDKDFFANVAVTSFGIMSPKTTGNVVNIIKNEFRTKQEVLDNQNLAVELIELNEAIPASAEDAKVIRERKRNILEELALNDAVSLHKLRYMTPVQIEEVADLNRQKRKLKEQMFSLGRTGERSKVQEQKQAEINKELSAIERKQQEILNSKERANRQKAKQVSEELGDSFANADAAYWYGFNDFYNEIAMTQMGDGDFISATAEVNNELGIPVLDYKNLDEELKKYNETDRAAIKLALLGERNPETGEVIQPPVYAMQIGKDIIINQPLIDQQIGLTPTSSGAKYAALAPLEELFHLNNKGKKMKFDGDAKLAVDEAIKVLENKLELGEISQENFNDLTERFKLYKDGETFDVEELIAQMNNAVALGDIKLSDIASTPSLKSFLNGAIRNVFGDQSWMLNLKTSDDVFNFIKNFQADIQGEVSLQLPDEDDSTIKSSLKAEDSAKVNEIFAEKGTDGSFEILELLKPTAVSLANRFNKRPSGEGSDRQLIEDPEAKQLLVDEIMTGNRGMLDVINDYAAKVEKGEKVGPLSGFLNNSFSTKTGFKRYIDVADRVVGKEFGQSVDNLIGLEDTDATTTSATTKGDFDIVEDIETRQAQSPRKTTKFNTDFIQNLDIEIEGKTEAEINEEVQEQFDKAIAKDLEAIGDVTTFGQTKNIGPALAALMEKATQGRTVKIVNGVEEIVKTPGIPAEVFSNKSKNIAKKDATSGALTALKQFLDANAQRDFNNLPDAFSKDTGKATFIPENVKKALYRKNNKGKFVLDKSKSVSDYRALLGDMEKPVYRASEAQTIKGLIALSLRNRMFEQAMPSAEKRSATGVKFSKSDTQNLQEILSLDIKFSKATPSQKKDIIKKGNDLYRAYQEAPIKTASKLRPVFKEILSEELFSDRILSEVTSPIIRSFVKYEKYKDQLEKVNVGKVTVEEIEQQELGTNLIKALVLSDQIKSFSEAFSDDFLIQKQRNLFDGFARKKINSADDLITILKIFRGHQTSAGKIGGSRNQIFSNNKDFIDELNKIESVDIKYKSTGSGLQITSVSYDGKKIDDFKNKIQPVQQKSYKIVNGKKIPKTKEDFKKELPLRKKEAQENWNELIDYLQYIKDNGTRLDFGMTMMSLKSNMSSMLKAAAPVKYYWVGPRFNKVTYEHMIPTESIVLKLTDHFYNKKIDLEALRQRYNVAIIPDIMDNNINIQRQKSMPAYWDETMSETLRYYDDLTLGLKNMFAIESLEDAKIYGAEQAFAAEINENVFKANNSQLPTSVKFSKQVPNPTVLNRMGELDGDAKQANKEFYNSVDLNKEFNDILEVKTGIASEKRYKRVKAEVVGANKGRFQFFIPPSAEDFTGLLYSTLAKGKLGDAQMAWYKKNLLDPYGKAMNELSSSRIAMMNDYKQLKKELEIVPKDLRKKVPGEPFTREQAVRVYIWQKQGMSVPGISEADMQDLSDFVANDTELQLFAEQLINIQKGDQYAGPKEGWPAGTITTDMLEGLNTTKRAKALEQWQANADEIFSEENLNKLEAAYGKPYRLAMENMLQRMKSGRNRNFQGDTLTGRFTDWVTGSIGTIMFFNTRSALLQTISSINFVNFTDNNILAAGKAFANQKQFWSDFMTLMNSDFLKERRGGLRINVSEADIADMAKKGGAKGVINKLLEFGFTPTQIADSFAIASGGSAFYRNRIKTYKKQGMTDAEAEAQAFVDFRETAEESQQSSRPDRISMQQAGPLGRLVLAFANTPAQYARLIKKAASDLKNGRGDAKTNISKIIYYGVAQNLLFNALQQALFAFAFDDDEEDTAEQQKKYVGIANGMMDSLLRGMGIGGAVVSVGKNSIIRIINEMEKKQPKLEKVGYEITKLSPPISAKLSRINQAARSYQWDKKDMMEKGWSLDNPAYLASANVIAALTNIPLDRAVKKTNNVVQATSQDLETWERLALLGGWQDWEIGIDEEKPANKPQPRKTKSRTKKRKTRKR